MHILAHELLPSKDVLITEFEKIEDNFYTLNEDANALFDISRQSFETDDAGMRVAWHDPVCSFAQVSALRRPEGEWLVFRDWVQSLPETVRAIEAGARLTVIALGLLWTDGDYFVCMETGTID
jgi:hypothetical protein